MWTDGGEGRLSILANASVKYSVHQPTTPFPGIFPKCLVHWRCGAKCRVHGAEHIIKNTRDAGPAPQLLSPVESSYCPQRKESGAMDGCFYPPR